MANGVSHGLEAELGKKGKKLGWLELGDPFKFAKDEILNRLAKMLVRATCPLSQV